jgi:selenocysteine lyase/cysteine desulfurase
MNIEPTTIEQTRAQLRAAMPVAERWAYFDHAAVAPLSAPAAAATAKWLDEAAREGDTVWPQWDREVEQTRQTASRLIGAEPSEIALVPNTTAGINLVAEGLDWRPGDNVVTLADEFPSNLYPWMHLADRGVDTRLVPTDDGRVNLDELAARCDDRTRVVSVSWIAYASGCRRDLAAIGAAARSCGALFFVDAIQGVGAFPLDVRRTPVDFLAADGHKWMLGPEGAGLAYIRRVCLPLLRPIGVGWNSVVQGGDFSRIELNIKPDASRYEGGSQNMAGMLALGASLRLLESLGIEKVAAAILDVTDHACDRLEQIGARIISPRGADERSGIVSFELPGADATAVRRRCLEKGVALACRGGRLRISPHAYNDEQDVDRLIESLKTSARE